MGVLAAEVLRQTKMAHDLALSLVLGAMVDMVETTSGGWVD